jgi:shikimate dehydrogenase
MQPTSAMQEVCALFGHPVAGNPTQYMMEKALARAGLDWRFLSFEVTPDSLGDAVRGLRAMGFKGAHIATPHQRAVVEFLDDLDPLARAIGAANCIVVNDDKLVGENTDGRGFVQALKAEIDPQGKHVLLLGAGAAARAIGVEVAKAGAAKITVVNRTLEHAEALAALVGKETVVGEGTGIAVEHLGWEGDYAIPSDVQIIVQATSLGMNDPKARVPVAFGDISKGVIAADVVVNPPDTRFLSEAKRAGAKTLDGIGMMVNQGALAFKLWTDVEPDVALMRDAVEEYLSL